MLTRLRRFKRNWADSTGIALCENAIQRWLDGHPQGFGRILQSEATAFRPVPPTAKNDADVTVITPDIIIHHTNIKIVFNDRCVLYATILLPDDTIGEIHQRIDTALESGIPLVWAIQLGCKCITVYTTTAPPEMFNTDHVIPEHAAMPGFNPNVAELFD